MILIKDVDIIRTERDFHEVMNMNMEYDYFWTGNTPQDLLEKELVRGTRFINQWGEEVVIGAIKKVQDTIGLPFEVFENEDGKDKYDLIKRIEKLKDDKESLINDYNELLKKKEKYAEEIDIIEVQCDILKNELQEYKNMSFWERLKFLFTGEL